MGFGSSSWEERLTGLFTVGTMWLSRDGTGLPRSPCPLSNMNRKQDPYLEGGALPLLLMVGRELGLPPADRQTGGALERGEKAQSRRSV